jgi:putative selenium metabolism hydrolase
MSIIDRAGLIAFTRDLVRTPSVLGTEGAAAKRVVAELWALGFDRVETDEAGSVVGVVEGASAGPTVLFDAHLDTVDVEPADQWTRDPFGGEMDDGRIWGRGASDMKGALAGMVHALAALERSDLRGRAIVSASVEEERIEGAALDLICRRERPDFVVVGEASGLDLVRAGRGRAEIVLRALGRPAHASSPELGVHAVHRMNRIITEIEALPRGVHPFIGAGEMCLTDIISEPYPAHSVVPSGCRATYERRLVPGETPESVLGAVREACLRAEAEDTEVTIASAALETYTGYRIERRKWLAPWELNEDHELVRRSFAALESTGLEPALTSYSFCTNAAYSAGEAGLPTIGFGPGREEQAHIVDEYVEIAELEAAAHGYQAIARELLG